MKKIIRILSKLSGVESDIKKDTLKEVGDRLTYDSTWFSSTDRANISNALYIYGVHLKECKFPDVNKLRATTDDLNNCCLQLSENEPTLRKILWAIQN